MYLEINGRRDANGSVSPPCFVHPKLVWLLHMKRQKSDVRSGIDLFEVVEFNRPWFFWGTLPVNEHSWLVVWNIFTFSIYRECHHPN